MKDLRVGSCGLYDACSGSTWVATKLKQTDGYPIKIKKPLAIHTIHMGRVDYFERKLDDKRRLTIPAELRAEFANGVVVTRGFQKYLHVYAKAVWDEIVEAKLEGDILSEQVADLNVQFRMGKTESEIDDKQGRLVIEQHLLDYAGIGRDVVAVRAGKYWRLMAAP